MEDLHKEICDVSLNDDAIDVELIQILSYSVGPALKGVLWSIVPIGNVPGEAKCGKCVKD